MTRTPTKSATPVATALARPIPAKLAAAVQKSKAALAALYTAQAALSEFREKALGANVSATEAELASAVARQQVSRLIGDDVSGSDAELAMLRQKHDEAVTARASRDGIIKGFLEEIERRREVSSEANAALSLILQEWSVPVLAAADEHLAEAVKLVAEARLTYAALKPLAATHEPLILARIGEPGFHHGPKRADLPAAIDDAVQSWHRGFSATLRG